MSETDSFIEEVTEEVRRDRLFALMRRYMWIAVLAIILIVGGAAFSEYRKAQARAQAEALGDAMLAALSNDENADRAAALAAVDAGTPAAAAVLRLLTAAEQVKAGEKEAAIKTLDAISLEGEAPQVYRQIAQFKSLALQGDSTPVPQRRQALEAMSGAGNPLRLLAAEQMALIDIQEGESEAAIARYQAILSDAEVTTGLQQRALQVIVALGGEPELAEQAQDNAGGDGQGDN